MIGRRHSRYDPKKVEDQKQDEYFRFLEKEILNKLKKMMPDAPTRRDPSLSYLY